jgi:integrase
MSLRIVWRRGNAQLHGTIAGERIRRSAKTRDPEIADRIRAETEARLARASLYGPENEATFADACVLYLDAGKSNRYITPILKAFGKRRLATIKPGEIKGLARKLYPHGKGSTLNRAVVKPARAVINFASEHGLCAPIRIKGYYEPQVERPAGDRAWIDQFMAHAVDQRLRVMCLFMYVTAARIGECIALEPRHLDLDRKRVVGPTTKNGDPGIYYLTNELVRELRGLQARRTHNGRGELRIFGWASKQGVTEAWRRTCERAGIPYLTPHEAGRHGFGTEMVVRRGVDVVTAARLGRWRDPTVLLRRYAHAVGLGETAEAVFGRGSRSRGAKLARTQQRVPQPYELKREIEISESPRWGGVARRGV